MPPEPADYRHREHPSLVVEPNPINPLSVHPALQDCRIKILPPYGRMLPGEKRNISRIKQSHTPGDNISKPSLHLASSDLRSRYFVQEIHYQFSKQLHITTQSESHPTGSRCSDLKKAKLSKVKAAPGTPLLHRTNQRYHE